MKKALALFALLALVLSAVAFFSHASSINPPKPRIDLQQVGLAFASTTGSTRRAWLQNFENQVNQIYTGRRFVNLSVRRSSGRLAITGYVELNRRRGFNLGDREIFSLRQVPTVSGAFSYEVLDHTLWVGYRMSYTRRPRRSPFYRLWIQSRTWRYYYTPRSRILILRRRRRAYRRSRAYRRRSLRYRRYLRSTRQRRIRSMRRIMRGRRGGKW